MSRTVNVVYNADSLTTTITVDGSPFDTSRINGKPVEDWAYPFMLRKIRWKGFYDEMVEALGGEKEFNLIFEGDDNALNELKEAWEDAPVTVVCGSSEENVVLIEYDENSLSTKITINDTEFDTSRINGKEIADWVYPFMLRKIKWEGIFEEIKKVLGSDEYIIEFSGSNAAMNELMEECPESVAIKKKKTVSFAKNIDTDTSNGPFVSDDVNEVLDFFNGDWEEADSRTQKTMFDKLVNLAENGNTAAQDALAVAYQYGKCTSQDDSKAIYWYEKSAQAEDVDGMYHYANCLYYGWCTAEDEEQALYWYKKAAERGNKFAQDDLGLFYELGTLCEENPYEAVKWYRKSAEQGYSDAQFHLGNCCLDGIGTTENADEAAKWFRKAAEQGNESAQYNIGWMYYVGRGVPEDNDEAVKWFMLAADNGQKLAFDKLGECYYNGYGVQQSYDDAFYWYSKAAEEDVANAQKLLGVMYENGNGVTKNYSRAIEWYKKAAEQGEGWAQLYLGGMYDTFFYHDGYSGKNNATAVKWYRKAIENEISEAYYRLGNCYKDGRGVNKDKEKAKELFSIGADMENENCATALDELIRKEGYIDTAKKIGGGLLGVLGTIAGGMLQSGGGGYDDDDDDYY